MNSIKITTKIENKVRPCLVGTKGKRKALFHCWENKPDRVLGIVEFNNGEIHETYPEEIQFVDDWVDEFHANL